MKKLIVVVLLVTLFIAVGAKGLSDYKQQEVQAPLVMSLGLGSALHTECHERTCEISFGSRLDQNDLYTTLESVLRNASADDTFIFYFAGYGGDAVSLKSMYNAITMTKAKTISVVQGDVFSAYAILPFAAKTVIMYTDVVFMFHTVQSGKSNAVPIPHVDSMGKYRAYFNEFLRETLVTPGILTEKEYQYITTKPDKELYLSAKVITTRLANHKKNK